MKIKLKHLTLEYPIKVGVHRKRELTTEGPRANCDFLALDGDLECVIAISGKDCKFIPVHAHVKEMTPAEFPKGLVPKKSEEPAAAAKPRGRPPKKASRK